jgi:hypothetical protein
MTNGHQSPWRAYKHGWFAQVAAPSLQLAARACMLQPPLGGQAAVPSMQLTRPLPKNGFEGPTWILPLSANPGKDRAQTAFFEVSQAGTASECHKYSILIF